MFKTISSGLPAFKKSKKFLTTLALDIAAKGIPYLLLPFFLQLMPQAEFGLYTYLVYIILSVSTFMKFGLDTSLTKMFYEYSGKERGTMLFTINVLVFGFFAFFLCIGIFTSFDEYLLNLVLKTTNISIELTATFWLNLMVALLLVFLNVHFVIAEKFSLFQKFNLIRLLVSSVLVLAFLYYANSSQAIGRLRVEGMVSLIILIPLVFYYLKDFHVSFSRKFIQIAFRLGIPIFLSNILSIASGFSDKFLIQDKKSISELAIYNLALFLSLPISLLFSSFHSLWLPKFFKEVNLTTKFRTTTTIFKKLLLIFLGFIIIIWIGLWAALQLKIVPIEYAYSQFIFPMVALGFALECLNQLYFNVIITIGKTEITFFTNLVMVGLIFSLNYWLIPIYGIMASAIIYCCINIARVLVLHVVVKNRVEKLQIVSNTQLGNR